MLVQHCIHDEASCLTASLNYHYCCCEDCRCVADCLQRVCQQLLLLPWELKRTPRLLPAAFPQQAPRGIWRSETTHKNALCQKKSIQTNHSKLFNTYMQPNGGSDIITINMIIVFVLSFFVVNRVCLWRCWGGEAVTKQKETQWVVRKTAHIRSTQEVNWGGEGVARASTWCRNPASDATNCNEGRKKLPSSLKVHWLCKCLDAVVLSTTAPNPPAPPPFLSPSFLKCKAAVVQLRHAVAGGWKHPTGTQSKNSLKVEEKGTWDEEMGYF